MITAPSPQYLDQLRHAHEGHLRVKLYSAGTLIGELPTQSVRLTLDGNAEIWRTADLSFGLDFWETETRDFVEQANVQTGEVTIEHGIKWAPTDQIHWVQLARLRIDQMNMALLSAGRNVTAYDRALLLSEHNLPTTRPLNNTYVNLIKTMVSETLPGETVTVESGIDTVLRPGTGKSLGLGANRLTEIQHLADSIDGVLHNTNTGAFRISRTDIDRPIVWNVDDGVTGVLIDMTQDFARAEQYNAVGIEYSSDEEATPGKPNYRYVYAMDLDPTSPTYYNGPFGKRNIFFQEEYDHVPTEARAMTLAQRKLLGYMGATRGLALKTVYNPLLQPGDHIRVTFPDTRVKEEHIIDLISLDLGNSAEMQIETRMKRDPATVTVVANQPPPETEIVIPELLPIPAHYTREPIKVDMG